MVRFCARVSRVLTKMVESFASPSDVADQVSHNELPCVFLGEYTMMKFCDITSRNELADFLGIPRQKLTYVLYVKKVDSYYKSFKIPKKNGDSRTINAPTDDLKFIQKQLANKLQKYQIDIWNRYKVSPNISHGFVKRKSIITNAKIHRNKKYVLNLDLKDFFDSFHFGRVRGFFEKNREFSLPLEVATVIAQLTCFKGALPQGAPSSPVVTNLMCQILDNRLLKISKKYKLDYTRYADDLTFSTNNKLFLDLKDEFFITIKKEIEHAGFKINEKKTRLLYKDSKQTVTGLVVNKKINVDQGYYRKTKSMAHSLYMQGEFTIDGQPGTIEQLEGRFSFINQLDWYNNKLDNQIHNFDTLTGREREFKRFLFYKYFYGNSTPIVVTEGKTDVRYLKSALKSLYKEYPNLISKTIDGKFEYKISFLKRTKRLEYFLNIRLDGADTIQNIYKYFVDGKARERKKYPNYFNYFQQSGITPHMPVVLLFDNELESKRPLRKFLLGQNFSDEQIDELRNNQYLKILENGNLFLLTNPLISGKKECEIEYLFSQETLNHQIDGKKLCLKDNYDTNQYYGKEIFSQYILSNFKNIDFTGFRPLLNKLDLIVTSYSST